MVKIFNDYIQPEEIHQCRICLTNQGKTIVPCKCEGSIKYVHEDCIKDWMTQNLKNKIRNKERFTCQLCKQNIQYETDYFFHRFFTWNQIKNQIQKLIETEGKFCFTIWSVIFFISVLDILFCIAWYIYCTVEKKYGSKYYQDWLWWFFLFNNILNLTILIWSIYKIVNWVIKKTLKISQVKQIQKRQNTQLSLLQNAKEKKSYDNLGLKSNESIEMIRE